jgi:hypothetical protein
MFEKLKLKWKVSTLQLVLILCTFAIGGSIDGRLTHGIMSYFFDEKPFYYWLIYFVILTILWPLCVILVSIPMGQFVFFKNYLTKMSRISGN